MKNPSPKCFTFQNVYNTLFFVIFVTNNLSNGQEFVVDKNDNPTLIQIIVKEKKNSVKIFKALSRFEIWDQNDNFECNLNKVFFFLSL